MAICTRCGGEGFEYYEEDYRMIRDSCYHCSETGMIDEDTYWNDRLSSVATTLADLYVSDMRKAINEDPDGDGWTLHAAENGLSDWDYYRTLVWKNESVFLNKLFEMKLEDQQFLVALNEMPPKSFSIPKKKEVAPIYQSITFNELDDSDQIPF